MLLLTKTQKAHTAVSDAVVNFSPSRAPLPNPLTLILIAATIGAIYTLYLFPRDFLMGTSAFWRAPPIADLDTQIAGARYYTSDAWWFPIFRTVKIAPPYGTSIIYMDTLPVFAVIAKLLRYIINPGGVYFGIWIAVCYVLQAISSIILLMAVGVRSYAASIAGSVIALSMPSFLFRLFHPTLCAHFLVLLALSLYFTAIRSGSLRRVWPWFVLLSWLSLWVQAYLFVMVATVLFATCVQRALPAGTDRRVACTAVVCCVAGGLCLMWVSGYFWERSTVQLWDLGTPEWFGRESMNLLSPVIPQWSELLPGASRLFGPTNGPYEAVGVIDATGSQYEGYNYLGAGILLLTGVALLLDRREFGSRVRKYWALVAALLVLTALAVTHRIYFGGWGIALSDKVPLLLEDLRSSGRLFWPVAYTVMAYAVTVVFRHFRGSVGAGLLLVAASVQVADAAWIRDWIVKWTIHEYTDRFVIPARPWIGFIRDHQAVSIFPTYACAAENEVWNLIAEIVFHASQSLTPVNTAAIDRVSNVDCRVEARSLRQLTVNDGTLLVLLSPTYTTEFATAHPDYRQICRSFDKGWACTRHWQRVDRMGWNGPFQQL